MTNVSVKCTFFNVFNQSAFKKNGRFTSKNVIGLERDVITILMLVIKLSFIESTLLEHIIGNGECYSKVSHHNADLQK